MSTTTENRTGTATRTVVVVGHGMVGHRFVEALRSRDTGEHVEVVVLCEEPGAAYDRVGLSSFVEDVGPERPCAPRQLVCR